MKPTTKHYLTDIYVTCQNYARLAISPREDKLTRKQLLVSKIVVPLSPLRSRGALLSPSRHRLVSLSEGFHSELHERKIISAIAVLIFFVPLQSKTTEVR